jgi:hypothetical protein
VYKRIFIAVFFFFLGNTIVFAQGKTAANLTAKDSLKSKNIDPLTPAKAAFYSAILPGLGQAYNNKYHHYRDAYKRRLEGYSDDELGNLDTSRLISGQKFYQRNRDLSALFVVGFYVLNIIDANIDAALIQFNVNENLSLRPAVYPDDVTFKPNVGLTLNYNF